MIVIADTTPLRHLVEINQVEVLERLYGQIVVPTSVWNELQHSRTPANIRTWVEGSPAWIEVRNVMVPNEALPNLGPGERESITLNADPGLLGCKRFIADNLD